MRGITFTMPTPLYGGAGANVEIPAKFDIALDGRGYMLDASHPAFGGQSAYLGHMGVESIPLIRQQADNSSEPGEGSINPEDLWSRAQSSWHKGAGQQYLDSPTSDRNRFYTSSGIDPWTLGQLKLLSTTTRKQTSSNTNVACLSVGSYLYYADGTTLKHTVAPYTSLTDTVVQNGETAASVQSIASDGYNVYAALGANGIHTTTRGATTSTHYSNVLASLVGYVKGRLMAAETNKLYNIVASGAAPTPTLTHPNTDFRWVAFAGGLGFIYAGGFSGDKSYIYKTAVKADGTALDVASIAGELPDGEIIRSLVGYLGFIVIGTDLGFRLATEDTNGNLSIGALVQTGSPCQAFEPQSRFVWFGWDNFSASNTGLGRIDLSEYTAPSVPAYASDIMASSFQGAVTSIATVTGNLRAFTVSGQGLFVETTTSLATGTLSSGSISYGIPDKKIALRLAMKHKPLVAGSISASVSADSGTLTLIGTSDVAGSTAPSEQMKIPEVSAQFFDISLTLNGTGTVLERYDFRAYPTSRRGQIILAPILLHEMILTATGKEHYLDVAYERQLIESYVGADKLVSYQEMGITYSVLVEDANFQREAPTSKRQTWNGTLLCKLKVLGN